MSVSSLIRTLLSGDPPVFFGFVFAKQKPNRKFSFVFITLPKDGYDNNKPWTYLTYTVGDEFEQKGGCVDYT